ncbi:MAG TPA: hypothetical protein VMU10_02035, partial [Desulfomonilia bacterium]|nr:hypothetical protein [Desulfomonilia bacterium]
HPYADQWGFMTRIRKLSDSDVSMLISKLCHGNELGVLKRDDEEEVKPWEPTLLKWTNDDFPQKVELVRANMLYIKKSGISQRALNVLKRLAAFKNPEFYKAQSMRISTYGRDRIISCSDETSEYLCLPRGCEADVRSLLAEAAVEAVLSDYTNSGRSINVSFRGETFQFRNYIQKSPRMNFGTNSLSMM